VSEIGTAFAGAFLPEPGHGIATLIREVRIAALSPGAETLPGLARPEFIAAIIALLHLGLLLVGGFRAYKESMDLFATFVNDINDLVPPALAFGGTRGAEIVIRWQRKSEWLRRKRPEKKGAEAPAPFAEKQKRMANSACALSALASLQRSVC
jgi:hypothetical protein